MSDVNYSHLSMCLQFCIVLITRICECVYSDGCRKLQIFVNVSMIIATVNYNLLTSCLQTNSICRQDKTSHV